MKKEKVYRGKVKKVKYIYDESNIIQKIGAEIEFKNGSVFIQTEKNLNVLSGDVILFTAFQCEGEWWIDSIIKVVREKKKKLTSLQKKVRRIMEIS